VPVGDTAQALRLGKRYPGARRQSSITTTRCHTALPK
jgi:hypothetical protein